MACELSEFELSLSLQTSLAAAGAHRWIRCSHCRIVKAEGHKLSWSDLAVSHLLSAYARHHWLPALPRPWFVALFPGSLSWLTLADPCADTSYVLKRKRPTRKRPARRFRQVCQPCNHARLDAIPASSAGGGWGGNMACQCAPVLRLWLRQQSMITLVMSPCAMSVCRQLPASTTLSLRAADGCGQWCSAAAAHVMWAL